MHEQLLGFGLSLLSGVDPNPSNFVCAGIIFTKNSQIGILLRLEPNAQAEVCLTRLLSSSYFYELILL